MYYNLLLLTAGFLLLVKGADYFVGGSVSLSKKLKIPTLIIGLTVVAFGTSAPELFVSLISALNGAGDITLSNVIGSNIANVLLILGTSAIVFPLATNSKVIVREVPFLLLTTLALWFIADDALFGGGSESIISRGDAYVLLLLFAIFVYYLVSEAIKARNEAEIKKEYQELEGLSDYKKPLTVFFSIVGGILMLAFGGKLVVDSAIFIAELMGISGTLIGLTVVAIGSSLPELVTTIIAVRRKEALVAIGNVVGSSIFNTVFVIGVSGAVVPLTFNTILRADIIVMLITSVLLFLVTLTGKKITRLEGVVLFVAYSAYMIFVITRG